MQKASGAGKRKTGMRLVTDFDRDTPVAARLVITSYEWNKIDRCYRAVLANRKGMDIDIGRPKRAKVVLGGREPPLWGCKGSDLRRVVVPLKGTVGDMVKLTTLKTIVGVYAQLLLQDARIRLQA